MHELALCQALIEAVEKIARREHASGVVSLTVTVGALSGVEPSLLARAFEIASASTLAQGARLLLEPTPVRVVCEDCGAQGEATIQRLLCASCGGGRVRVTAGDELHLSRIELERASTVPQCDAVPATGE